MLDPRTTCSPSGLEGAHLNHSVDSVETTLLMAPRLVALSLGRPIKPAPSATRKHNRLDERSTSLKLASIAPLHALAKALQLRQPKAMNGRRKKGMPSDACA